MGPRPRIPIKEAVFTTVTVVLALSNGAEAQQFKTPLNVSHLVYRPGEDIAELEGQRGWTFGLGLMIGVRGVEAERKGIYGLTAQATYGGPYWYIGGGAGMWNSGSPTTDNFGFGVNAHYNVFQSRDFRTRLGPRFGWSSASTGNARTRVLTYGALMSHTVSPSLSLYGGLGAETSRIETNGERVSATHPSLLGGIYAHLGQGFSVSTGVESVFTDPLYLTFAGSVQFEPGRRHPPDLESSRTGLGRPAPPRR